ncbi:MAG: SDR family NAD(P)-dependent oxidoreductase [Alphaproteobacteria bacterium]|nr:SDR family NAD(P)-dependent oxidoreductase [Alphaproteobacteria bacterium]MBU0859017.1 SDR family NAD(P)-dependent oxidoreductase [Alphaproteobacteria bacterium]
MKDPRSILITGASSGIGAALAVHYARAGVHLFLGGRNQDRLLAVADKCRARGAVVEITLLDVTKREETTAWVQAADDRVPLDLVIANAGVSGGTGGVITGEPAEQTRHIFAVNVDGVLNTIEGVQDRMVVRGRGQLAIMSSLASFAAWPGAPAYSASKAAVRVYGEALHGALKQSGVRVSVICPGFIETPMTAVNGYKMPFMMGPERAAALIAAGLARGAVRVAFPLRTYVFAALPGFLPPAVMVWLLGRMPAKPAQTQG